MGKARNPSVLIVKLFLSAANCLIGDYNVIFDFNIQIPRGRAYMFTVLARLTRLTELFVLESD